MTVNEVAAYLATVSPSLGTIKTRFMPDTPDAILSLMTYGGPPPNMGFGVDGIQHEEPGIQIRVRGTEDDDSGPEAICYSAYKAMAKVQALSLSGVLYLMVRPQQSPFRLERDGKRRSIWACNFLCEKVPS